MVVEYTLRLYTGDLNPNDVITIVEKVREGWRAKLNNKIDVILVNEKPAPTIVTSPHTTSVQNKHFEGWVLLDSSRSGSQSGPQPPSPSGSRTRWTKSWMVMNTVPMKFGIFESEIQKAEKMRSLGDAALEDLEELTELETLRRDKTPAEMHPVKFRFKTPTRTLSVIVSAKDSMTDKTREVCRLLKPREPAPPSSPERSRRNAATSSVHVPAQGVHLPPSFDLSFKASTASASAPTLGGITKVQGIMGKPFKSFFKAETKPDKVEANRHTYAQAPTTRTSPSTKSVSISEPDSRRLQSSTPTNTEPFVVTKIYWQDGTYKTVAVKPKMSTEELCDVMTKKTKMATFSNLFRLYLRTHTSADRLLQPDSNIFEMIMSWGQNTLNYQVVCDLDVSAKNTVKMHLEKRTNPAIPSMSPTKQSPTKPSALQSTHSSEGLYEPEDEQEPLTTDNFLARKFAEFEANGFPEDEVYEEEDLTMDEDIPEDSSIAMMIEEMMKLKAELQEEQNQIAQLHMEDQNLNFLIGRLAQMQ